MNEEYPLDLVVLVPGKDDHEVIDGLLSKRGQSLGIRYVNYKILVHPRRDPGCFHEAQDILQPYLNRSAYALVVFDHEGSGQEARLASEVAADLTGRLRQNGWRNRARVLVIKPELEIWAWSDSPQVDAALGWAGRPESLRRWLMNKGFWPDGDAKPHRPKECLIEVLREVRIRRSSAIYRDLAEKVGLQRCQDPTFDELRNVIRSWFPGE